MDFFLDRFLIVPQLDSNAQPLQVSVVKLYRPDQIFSTNILGEGNLIKEGRKLKRFVVKHSETLSPQFATWHMNTCKLCMTWLGLDHYFHDPGDWLDMLAVAKIIMSIVDTPIYGAIGVDAMAQIEATQKLFDLHKNLRAFWKDAVAIGDKLKTLK